MNTVSMPTKTMSKQEYNRRYYQLRKEKLLAEKKSHSGAKVLRLLVPVEKIEFSLLKTIKPSLRCIEIIALTTLIFVMTTYLIRESALFYLEAMDAPWVAYMKAGMVEGIAVLFSFSRGRSFVLRWSQKIVVVLLCTLTLWTMTGKLVKSASQDTSKTRSVMQVIADLETERSQKEGLRQELLSRGWIGAVRKSEKSLDQIRERITQARQELAGLQAPHIILNSLGILIAFRLLIVASNLICFHRVSERLGLDAMQKPGISSA